jgi:hypothetical protein
MIVFSIANEIRRQDNENKGETKGFMTPLGGGLAAAARACSVRSLKAICNDKIRMTKKRQNGSPALVNVTGEIRAADLDHGTFILRLSDGTRVRGTFSPVQEEVITGALREHASRRLHLRGRGEFQRGGKLKRIVSVKHLSVKSTREKPYNATAKPIWEIAKEIGAQIPAEEWARVPTDLARNLDHYLYGAAKVKA